MVSWYNCCPVVLWGTIPLMLPTPTSICGHRAIYIANKRRRINNSRLFESIRVSYGIVPSIVRTCNWWHIVMFTRWGESRFSCVGSCSLRLFTLNTIRFNKRCFCSCILLSSSLIFWDKLFAIYSSISCFISPFTLTLTSRFTSS